jgi:hypothetical protein
MIDLDSAKSGANGERWGERIQTSTENDVLPDPPADGLAQALLAVAMRAVIATRIDASATALVGSR